MKNPLGDALDAISKSEEKKEPSPDLKVDANKDKEVHSNIEDKIKEESKEVSETVDTPEFTEESFYKYASETLGRDVKSKEDFFKRK